MLQSLLKVLISKIVAEGMQDKSSLLVQVTVEQFSWIHVRLANDRATVPFLILLQVQLEIVHLIIGGFVSSEIVFFEQYFGIGCKPLIEPCMRPITARDQIAPPLMRQLMGY